MKRCSRCKFHRPESDFYDRGNGRLMSHCKECINEKQRLNWSNPDYADAVRKKKAGKMDRLRQFRQILSSIKAVPCMDCGVTYPPYVMDFDHRPGEEKLFTIASQLAQVGLEKLLAEVEKCDIVCANCHRVRTHERDTYTPPNRRKDK